MKSHYATISNGRSQQYWGRHLWARGYFAVTSGTITDDMINEYISEQEGEPVVEDSRFQIDST